MRPERKPVPYHIFCERPQPPRSPLPTTPDYVIRINWDAMLGAGLLLGSIAGLAWFFWTQV